VALHLSKQKEEKQDPYDPRVNNNKTRKYKVNAVAKCVQTQENMKKKDKNEMDVIMSIMQSWPYKVPVPCN